MRRTLLVNALFFLGLTLVAADAAAEEEVRYRGWFDVPGGELPFGIVLTPQGGGWTAELENGSGRVPVEICVYDEDELQLELSSYDSRIVATSDDDGASFTGEWTKVRGPDKLARVPFHARRGDAQRFPLWDGEPARTAAGRWTVDFESDELPAVAIFERVAGSADLTGTFLTATGDYRWLAGTQSGDEIRLSCFDGGHAFLFHARLTEDGGLAGDFWSGDWYHETWTARRDEDASLGDAFAQTTWTGGIGLGDLLFPDLHGSLRSLAEPDLVGHVTILQVFGSWCPNCHDETMYLVDLDRRYRDKGVSIVGLACELTGDFERDARQVEVFLERYGVEYPVLLAGTANKAQATLAFGAVDRVRSFPTTIFLDGSGRVREVHSGFTGPATGAEYEALCARFEALLDELLAEEPPPEQAWKEIEGERFWFDRAAGLYRDPFDFGRRLVADDVVSPFLASKGIESEEELLDALEAPDPLVRREAIVALVAARNASPVPEAIGLLDDGSVAVRIAATWAMAETNEKHGRERIYENLEHPNPALRLATVQAMIRMGASSPNVLLHLDVARNDPVQQIRELVSDAMIEGHYDFLRDDLQDLGYGDDAWDELDQDR